METEVRNQNQRGCKPLEPEVFLQWGKRKRLRCPRNKDPEISERLCGSLRKKIGSRSDRCVISSSEKERIPLQPNRLTRNSEGVTTLRNGGAGTSPSPEKEDRYYATRGSTAAVVDENGHEERGGSFVLPKLLIALSSKEKEEDFMAMKGCKLPQRPKKRAKMIQRSLLLLEFCVQLVSPGAWLTEMSQERYEVREKKTTKKRPTGLKAMGSTETDSE
ncbi:uncharacterized protein LOC120091318 isoform X1 [Benincasa hispida]|uniref:uncharacterized protein LOC120091318 isoform X1 n=1 Tax=Benincasa hispida TaxID=102211 RepID=UPI0018FFAA35|nr:uncharacterized protein LOC120091318 isoform X1 [Benincasa hispida]XP_038905229.1 uncharacterized protein LOC120091318 isoform X1 [Benincasa hispida]XP_038905230.1 uncharacterized protein LOC120091318 isoform X1 [Benincasa hispida]